MGQHPGALARIERHLHKIIGEFVTLSPLQAFPLTRRASREGGGGGRGCNNVGVHAVEVCGVGKGAPGLVRVWRFRLQSLLAERDALSALLLHRRT